MSAPPPTRVGRASAARWRWSTWSLTRKLPVLTAVVVVLVVGTSLALAYDALRRARIEGVHERLQQLVRQIVAGSETTMRARAAVFRQAAADPAVHAALRDPAAPIASAESVLARLRAAPDSSLPIELWSVDGGRVARVGREPDGDSLAARSPELRGASGPFLPATAPADTIQYGAFYGASGGVFYWTLVPVMEGSRRIGVIAQQRRYSATTQNARTVKALIGDEAELYLHNTTDNFWSSYTGAPTSAIAGLDTSTGDYRGERVGVGDVIAAQARVTGTAWGITLEAPVSAVLLEPRATLRRLAMISALIAFAGVAVAWLVSRRITAPLASLTEAAESIARGEYATRVQERRDGATTDDEVARLAASVNRMVGEVEQSHRALEQRVAEARSVSEELAHTNEELRQITAEAGQARDAAEHANRAKSDFLAVMSHELRTPLNAIGGYTEIMQLGIYGEVSAQQRDALHRITRSQQLLLSLINDVLNFAKLDAGRVHFDMADVPLGETLGAVEVLVAPQLHARQITYSFVPPEPSLAVRADPEKLQQVVLNLLSNAIKFTEPRGRIALTCGPQGDDLACIAVADTGVGIAEDRLASIFDPFVQVGRALNSAHEGIGLGLSISRDLADAMGGSLTAESTPGVGSTFTLLLRRAHGN